MAARRPLVVIAGQLQELPAGDTLPDVAPVTGTVLYAEPVVVAGFNGDVIHATGTPGVPLFVTTRDGDIVTARV